MSLQAERPVRPDSGTCPSKSQPENTTAELLDSESPKIVFFIVLIIEVMVMRGLCVAANFRLGYFAEALQGRHD